MLLAQADTLISLKAQSLAIKKRKLDWMQKHRLYFYQPYCDEQRAFHESKAKVRALIGPNRIGKSTAGGVEDICFWLGFRPYLLPDELKSLPVEELLANYEHLPEFVKTPLHPPTKVILIVSDWDVADDIWTQGKDETAGKFKQFIPAGAIDKVEKNNMGNICSYYLKTFGSQIIVDTQKSFINDPQSFEGKQHDMAHYDEPPDRKLRVAVSRGLVDRGGYEIFTLTPLREAWIKNEIVDRAPTSNGKIEVINVVENQNPHISREGWEDYKGKLTVDEYKARAKGLWIHLEGLIYKEFEPKLSNGKEGHLVKELSREWIYNNCVVDVALDPHPRQPHAILFMATAKDGRRFIFDEIFSDTFLPDLCKLWQVKEQYVELEVGVKVIKQLPVLNRIADPLAFDEDPEDGRKWADAFADEGIFLDKASKRKEAGITATREAFKARNLFICENCTRTIFEIQNYTWDEWKYGNDRNAKEKPKDKDDHMMENMYRLILLETEYVDLRTPSKPFKLKDLAAI